VRCCVARPAPSVTSVTGALHHDGGGYAAMLCPNQPRVAPIHASTTSAFPLDETKSRTYWQRRHLDDHTVYRSSSQLDVRPGGGEEQP
jgi:hypothetical protein